MANLHKVRKKEKHDVFITPQFIIDSVHNVFGGIDLDPCTMLHNPTNSKHTFSDFSCEDGILESWQAFSNVYVNPPFSDVSTWVEKILNEQRPTILLCKADFRTQWFEKLIPATQSCFVLKGYLKFDNQFAGVTDYAAPFATMLSILYSTPGETTKFRHAFKKLGYEVRNVA